MKTKIYYGFRYYNGRTTTMKDGHDKIRIAGELVAFTSKMRREEWMDNEKLSASSGLDGGERVAITRAQARSMCGVDKLEQMREMVDYES